MHTPFQPRWLRLAVLGIFLLALPVWADEDPDQERSQILLQRLLERFKDPSGDHDKLRDDLLGLRRRYPGTTGALKAAELLRQMPSALDRLDPKNIPELERFAWQPRELVAVLGEHRGRHGNPANCVAFSPDGSLLVSGGGGYLRVWNPTTMRLIQTVSSYHPISLAFSKNGKMLAVCSSYPSASLYDVTAGGTPLQLRYTAAAGTANCYSVAFHPNNLTFAVACFDNHIRIYDASSKTAKEPILVQGHAGPVQAVAYSPDGKTLASGSADQTVRLWDATREIPREKAVLAGHPAAITSLAFNPTGTTLASGCSDSSVSLWTIPAPARNGKPRVVFGNAKAGHIYNLNFSATGQTLAVACADGSARLWSLTARPRERFKLEGHAGSVTGVRYSPDNKRIATSSADWTCRTWDVSGAVPKERFVPWSHLSHVYSCGISPDCQTLASGSLDTVLRLWDVNRTEPKTRNYIKGDSIPLYAVAYSPDGSRLAVSGETGTIRQWDSATGKALRPCTIPKTPRGLTYSPDGNYLLAHHDTTAYLFDVQSGKEVRTLMGHTTPIASASIFAGRQKGRHLRRRLSVQQGRQDRRDQQGAAVHRHGHPNLGRGDRQRAGRDPRTQETPLPGLLLPGRQIPLFRRRGGKHGPARDGRSEQGRDTGLCRPVTDPLRVPVHTGRDQGPLHPRRQPEAVGRGDLEADLGGEHR